MTRLFKFGMVVLGMLVLMVTSDLYAARRASTTVTRLHGAAARAYIDGMYRRNPRMRADHEANVRALTRRGWKATEGEHDVVEIQGRKELPLQRVASLFVPSLVAQSFGLGDATLIYSPWDAGDPDTFATEVTIVGSDGLSVSGAYAMGIFDGVVRWFTKPWVQRLAWCTAGGCSGAGFSCLFSGPGWAYCTAVRCDTSFVACGVQEYFRVQTCRKQGKQVEDC